MRNLTIGATLALLVGAAGMAAAQPPVTEVDALEAVGKRTTPRIPITKAEYEALSKTDWFVPHYSEEQIASFECMSRRGQGYSLMNVQQAMRATSDFEETKRKYRAGQATIDDLILANNRRQDEVSEMLSRERSEARAAMASARSGRIIYKNRAPGFRGQDNFKLRPQLPKQGDLWIDKYSYRIENRATEQVMIVTVEFVNKGTRNAEPGEITISALDRAKYILADEGFRMGGGTLRPGQRGKAEFTFHNMPYYTDDINIRFGQPQFARNNRNCTVMEPFRQVAAGLGLSADDLEMNRLGDAATGVRGLITVENIVATPKQEGDDVYLLVEGLLRNRLNTEQTVPPSTLVLLDETGAPIGKAAMDLSSVKLDPNVSQTLTFKIRAVEPVGRGVDADLLALLKSVNLLIGEVD